MGTSRVSKAALFVRIVAGGTLILLPAAPIAAQNLVKVDVTEAKQQELIEEIPLSGSVTSSKRALVSTQVAGLISELLVDAGDVVSSGDLLLKLDPVLSEIDRDSAAANILTQCPSSYSNAKATALFAWPMSPKCSSITLKFANNLTSMGAR